MSVIGKVCDKHPELAGKRYGKECSGCYSERTKKYGPKRREYAAKSRLKCKEEVFNHYGGMKCSKCGFSHPDALVLDHEGGGGGKLRKDETHPWGGYALYVWLKNNNYPSELKFRVLCFNCNAIDSVARMREERKV